MDGLRIENQGLGSPFNGFFGFLVQKATNFALFVRNEAGQHTRGVCVEISYVRDSILTKEVIKYDPMVLYERAYPNNTIINYTVYGQGFVPLKGTMNIAPGQFITLSTNLKHGYIQVRRLLI